MRAGVGWRTAAAAMLCAMTLPAMGQITVTAISGGVFAHAETPNGPSVSNSVPLTAGGSFDQTVSATSTGFFDIPNGPRVTEHADSTSSLKSSIPNLTGTVISGIGSTTNQASENGGFGSKAIGSSVMQVTFTADLPATFTCPYSLSSGTGAVSVLGLFDVTAAASVFPTVLGGTGTKTGELIQGHTYQLIAEANDNVSISSGTPSQFNFTFTVTPKPDATSRVQITRSAFRYNSSTKSYVQRVTIKNISSAPIPALISLVLDKLSSNATLKPKDGVTTVNAPLGSSYVDFALAGTSLAPGEVATVSLNFLNPTNAAISYTPRVLSGAGAR